MQIDRTFPEAYLGLARVTADTNPAMARDIATRVLRFNPNLVDAHVLPNVIKPLAQAIAAKK